MVELSDPRPHVLLACHDAWMSRSFSSVFEEHGWDVMRVMSGPQALAAARRAVPDIILLDDAPGILDAVSTCRALHDDPMVDQCTPTIVTAAPHLVSHMAFEAYRAGAWEYCNHPVDLGLLMIKLDTFLRARKLLGVARAERVLNPLTGLYTSHALEQMSERLIARAARGHESLSCIVIAPQARVPALGGRADVRENASGFADIAALCRAQSRTSDIVGHVAESRFAILAPDTHAVGARLLVSRLQRALDQASQTEALVGDFGLRAGVASLADVAEQHVAGTELLRRAERTLDRLQASETDAVILGFDEYEEI